MKISKSERYNMIMNTWCLECRYYPYDNWEEPCVNCEFSKPSNFEEIEDLNISRFQEEGV